MLRNTSETVVYPHIIYIDDEQNRRKMIVIGKKSYYCSTGENSGHPNVWFPFLFVRGTQTVNYGAFPSSILRDNLQRCGHIQLGYIMKFEQVHSAEALEQGVFNGVAYSTESLAKRLPTKEDLIISVRLSGKHFPSHRLEQVSITADEKILMEQVIQVEDKPIFETTNPDKINQWLIEQGAEIPRAVLQDVNFSLEEKDIYQHMQCKSSLFMVAVVHGRVDILEPLVSQTNVKEYSVNRPRFDGWTPLMLAAERGHVDVINLLLKHGADVNLELSNGLNAFLIAAANGQAAAAKIFIPQDNTKAKIVDQQRPDGWNALMLAAEKGHVDVINLLLESGANTSLRLYNGLNAFLIAAANGHAAAVKLLMPQKNAKEFVDQQIFTGYTALMFAAEYGREDVVNLLLASGANAGKKLTNGMTAAALAEARGHMNIVEILKKHEKVNPKSNPLLTNSVFKQDGAPSVVTTTASTGVSHNLNND